MKYYTVDAFTNKIATGNPAGVCVLEQPLSDSAMQKIAFETGLPETAFLFGGGGRYRLRWFTPLFEMDLCGHGTLASAFVVFYYISPEIEKVEFETASGILTVQKKGILMEMEFPGMPLTEIVCTAEMERLLGVKPLELYEQRDLFAVLKDEDAIKAFEPDYGKLRKLKDWMGIVITAKGNTSDFVSRYFCPELRLEDPVTGSSHCSLIPFWSGRLKKTELQAKQLSQRGGTLYCRNEENCVKISGEAVLFLTGELCEP